MNADVDPGDFVRRRGCDLTERQKIVAKGEPIRATTIAMLASQGFREVSVGGEVDAAIISTGDELAEPGTKLQPGQIYESNSVMLQALLQRCGAGVKSGGHGEDEANSLRGAVEQGTKDDVISLNEAAE